MRSPMTADCFAGETSVVVLVIYRLEGREGAPCSPCRRIFCLAHRSIVDQPRPALVVNKTVVTIISYRPTHTQSLICITDSLFLDLCCRWRRL
jgi:hypothetical protein